MKEINCVFEGGGVKGIAFVGALQCLEDNGYKIKNVGGTSVGALIGSLVASGYTAKEMKEVLMDYDFKKLKAKNRYNKIPLVGKTFSVLFKKGTYPTKELEKWITNLLKRKGVHTFKDLDNELRIVAADITKKQIVILPRDLEKYNQDTNTFKVAKAVTLSSTIPLFFEPNKLDNSLIVDGGIISTYPIWIFNDKKNFTLGFLIEEEQVDSENKTLLQYLKNIIDTMIGRDDQIIDFKKHSKNTIKIPITGINATDFDLNKKQKEKLYQIGYENCKKNLNLLK